MRLVRTLNTLRSVLPRPGTSRAIVVPLASKHFRHVQSNATLLAAAVSTLALGTLMGSQDDWASMKSASYLTRNFIADAVEKAAPAVVNITIDYGHLQGMSSGSGFILDPMGLVVTNAHVVAHAGPQCRIKVTLANGESYAARVHSMDTLTDLALVQLEGPSHALPTMKIGSSSTLRAGEWVVALGSPLTLQNSVSAGIVSAVARHGSEIGLPNKRNHTEYIQTDAAINSGNSGGPLVNLDGEVIGINAMKVAGGSVSNISFAIPIDTAIEVIDQLRKQKTVMRPYVGMQMVQFSAGVLPEIAKLYPDLKQGVVVKSVTPGSPAAIGGLLPGDVIVEFAGTKVDTMKDITTALGYNVGLKMCMKVRRDGSKESRIFCFVTQDSNRRQGAHGAPQAFW
ncbi:serine protease family S01B [Achlya hypogyna]|uniref:Serine protease family S01B n=1 Tax=Achlya hypogyna TaxID=1202772 RepID=A0A1V9Z3W2_ACHHY|nr:serine protease family S01B [Achlya hypogyna]